jgi:hypothetical protein
MINILIGPILAVSAAASMDVSGTGACAPVNLVATTVRSWPAADADQGAAADGDYFYAIDNSAIAKHDRKSGELVGRWSGEAEGLVRHLNSCYLDDKKLYCANSNYPQLPMGSSAEIFDATTLKPLQSHSFGLMEEGSLTWFDRFGSGWIAGFTHYSPPKGLPYKDNRYSNVVRFDADWRRVGGWLYPDAILDRMAPYGASGGAIGPDGYLYVMGHDRPEMYVLAAPPMGPYLLHIATIAVEAEGQAFSFVRKEGRMIVAVNRRGDTRVLEIVLPELGKMCLSGGK